MTDREHEHWKDIQHSSHKEKLEYLLSLTKPGKNYFITPHYHTSPIKEFIDITDYEFIIWNGKMYRGYIETNVCIDDPEEFKRLAFDFHKYETEKSLDILE